MTVIQMSDRELMRLTARVGGIAVDTVTASAGMALRDLSFRKCFPGCFKPTHEMANRRRYSAHP
jgi:hypothetical protein